MGRNDMSYAQKQYLDRLILASDDFHDLDEAIIAAGFAGKLTANEASVLIDKLKAGTLTPPPRMEFSAGEGGMSAAQAFVLLGERVEVTGRGVLPDGSLTEPATFVMDVEAIKLSDITGMPVISGLKVENLHPASRHLHLIESWTVIG